MKLAHTLRNPVRQISNVARRTGPTRTLRTCPVVMRKAGKDDGGNLPAPIRGGRSALGFPALTTPFSARLHDIEREMESMLQSFGFPLAELRDEGSFLPRSAMSLAVDVQDTGDAFKINADVPGLKKEEIKVQVSPDHILTISGERKSETKEEDKGGFVRMERTYGSFSRGFRLPEHADTSAIKAEMNNGVLQLTVPKKEIEESQQKTISIEVGGGGGESSSA